MKKNLSENAKRGCNLHPQILENAKRGCNLHPQILVLGAGISGLSVAHHLVKLNIQNIVVIDKETTVGGLARSEQIQHNANVFHTEHCWRIVGSNYVNLLQVLKDINCLKNSIRFTMPLFLPWFLPWFLPCHLLTLKALNAIFL